MKLPVVLSFKAEQQLEAMTRWWAENRSLEQAERWYNGMIDTLFGLEDSAERCPSAPENGEFPFHVREVYFGLGRQPTHRALFTIRPDMVYVLLIRHLAQRDVDLDDV